MYEYLFMHDQPRDQFVTFVESKGITAIKQADEDGLMVLVEELDDDALIDEIESYYDEMLTLNESIYNEEAKQEQFHTAGLLVTLKDGRQVQAPVQPAMMNKLLAVLSMQELSDFVSIIADTVEDPDERSLCQRYRAGDLS